MVSLDLRFHQAMVNAYTQAKRDCGYNATRFLRMIATQGGVGAARSLLASGAASTGFSELWQHGRLDLSLEAHVVRPEYAALFSEAEREIAMRRLEEHGYAVERPARDQ